MKSNIDEKYMRIALKEAQNAVILDEVPVGAVIVKDSFQNLMKRVNIF